MVKSILLGLMLGGFICLTSHKASEQEPDIAETEDTYISLEEAEAKLHAAYARDNWGALIEALIIVESGGKENAIGDSGKAVGVLQIHPVYVAEVNKILGYPKYKLAHRYNRAKSIEMFDILQGKHNPAKDIGKAIKLHNPKGGAKYKNKVLREYNKIINL